MNKQGSKGIEWADYTLNPIVGCTALCPYCYARLAAKRMKCPDCQAYRPHFHPERLRQLDHHTPGRVFVGSMGEIFDPEADSMWWQALLLAHEASNFRHKLMVLTKRPDLISWADSFIPILKTIWLGVTVTCQEDQWRIRDVLQVPAAGYFVSLEPLLAPVDFEDIGFVCSRCDGTGMLPDGDGCGLCHSTGFRGMAIEYLDWLIIGGLSGSWLPKDWVSPPPAKRDRPIFREFEVHWANQIIAQAKAAGVPVFVKTKPVWLSGVEVIQEWPEGLR